MKHRLKHKDPLPPFRVFLSYATRDIALARQVQAAMSAVGAETFLADQTILPGETLKASILNAIRQCDVFVVLWSKNSAESDWVHHEIGQATGQGKRVVPFVLDKEANLPSFLMDIKHIRAYEGVEVGIGTLTERIAALDLEKRRARGDQQTQAVLVVLGAIVLLAMLNEGNG